ncbi:hypothetical protein [Mesorhizobium sp. M0408]|uniref:hypothetical protein n=1 Tax=Mesorhizobium sp. M0408 TaxID=2956942 RepID=UPI00333871D8
MPIAQIRKFKPELVAEVDRLLDRHCDREIADILNEGGLRTWEGKPFNLKKIAFIRGAYNLPSRRQRLRDCGLLTTQEVAEHFAIAETTVHQWGRQGSSAKPAATVSTVVCGTFLTASRSSKAARAETPFPPAVPQLPCHQPNRTHYETIALSRGFRLRVGRMVVS